MILVVAEQLNGTLNRASWEAIAAGQTLGGPLTIVLLGSEATGAAKELAAAEATEVISLEHAALGSYTADGFVQALAAFIPTISPELVIFSHTYQTRDYAPGPARRRCSRARCFRAKSPPT